MYMTYYIHIEFKGKSLPPELQFNWNAIAQFNHKQKSWIQDQTITEMHTTADYGHTSYGKYGMINTRQLVR